MAELSDLIVDQHIGGMRPPSIKKKKKEEEKEKQTKIVKKQGMRQEKTPVVDKILAFIRDYNISNLRPIINGTITKLNDISTQVKHKSLSQLFSEDSFYPDIMLNSDFTPVSDGIHETVDIFIKSDELADNFIYNHLFSLSRVDRFLYDCGISSCKLTVSECDELCGMSEVLTKLKEEPYFITNLNNTCTRWDPGNPPHGDDQPLAEGDVNQIYNEVQYFNPYMGNTQHLFFHIKERQIDHHRGKQKFQIKLHIDFKIIEKVFASFEHTLIEGTFNSAGDIDWAIKYTVYKLLNKIDELNSIKNNPDNTKANKDSFTFVDECNDLLHRCLNSEEVKHIIGRERLRNYEQYKISNIVSLLTSIKRSGDWGMSHFCYHTQIPLYTGDRPHAIYARMLGIPVICNSSFGGSSNKGSFAISYRKKTTLNIDNLRTALIELDNILITVGGKQFWIQGDIDESQDKLIAYLKNYMILFINTFFPGGSVDDNANRLTLEIPNNLEKKGQNMFSLFTFNKIVVMPLNAYITGIYKLSDNKFLPSLLNFCFNLNERDDIFIMMREEGGFDYSKTLLTNYLLCNNELFNVQLSNKLRTIKSVQKFESFEEQLQSVFTRGQFDRSRRATKTLLTDKTLLVSITLLNKLIKDLDKIIKNILEFSNKVFGIFKLVANNVPKNTYNIYVDGNQDVFLFDNIKINLIKVSAYFKNKYEYYYNYASINLGQKANVIKMITTLQTSFANLDIKINACIDLLTPEAMIFIKKRNPAEMEVDGDAAMEAQVKPSVHGGYARGWGPDGFDPKRYGTP